MQLQCVLTPSTVRLFPASPPPVNKLTAIDAALNERFSFQLALRADAMARVTVSATAPEGWDVRIRRVGFVPVPHQNTKMPEDPLDTDGLGKIPGYVPDPLFDEASALLPARETNAFWLTVTPAPGAKPGRYVVGVSASPSDGNGGLCGKAVLRKLSIRLHHVTILSRKGFRVTHWFHADALIDWYGTKLFDSRFWKIAGAFLRDVAEHGQDTVYVPVFTPPLDGVKRPTQLLRVLRTHGGRYSFDWRDVRHYVRLARQSGLTHFEWSHLFTQWGAHNAIRVYEGQGAGKKLLWPADAPATSAVYRDFLSQYLPELRRFLAAEGILDVSFFHVSDEPDGEEALANYRAARAILAKYAPWMAGKCIDAVSQVAYGKEPGLIDVPVPSISTALDFLDAGIASWCYYCGSPRGTYLNHLMDTPLAKVAMHGFLFYRWPFRGFLNWGLNYWYVSQTSTLLDPFTSSDANAWPNWTYGGPFWVYPGKEGPVDSIRWEVFAEAMQDYALLQTVGIPADDPLFAPIKSFADFPKDAAWRIAAKARLYRLADIRAKKKP